jgi:hypothetical protein
MEVVSVDSCLRTARAETVVARARARKEVEKYIMRIVIDF